MAHWVLQRWLNRLPVWLQILGLQALCIAIPLAPILLGTHVLGESTALSYSYPLFETFTFDQLWRGNVFWNALNFHGFPSFIGCGFSLNPLTYLATALLPPLLDVHWFIYCQVVSAAFFCSLFLRRLGCSPAAAMVGGFAYITGNWWIMPLAYYVPVLPMLPLLMLNLADMKQHPIRSTILGSILIGYIFLGVAIQVSLMLCTVYVLGALALLCTTGTNRTTWLIKLRPLLITAISLCVGVIIGAPKFLTSFTYGLLSWRSTGLSAAESTIEGLTPLSILQWIFPYIQFPFVNFGHGLLGVYIGTAALVPLCAGLISRAKYARAWSVVYILFLAMALNHSPLAAIVHSVPPFSFFRGAGRWTLIANGCAGILVAIGWDTLFAGQAERIRKALVQFLTIIFAAVVTACVLLQLLLLIKADILAAFLEQYFNWAHHTFHLTQPVTYYQELVQNRITKLQAWPIWLHPRFGWSIVVLGIAAVLFHSRFWPRTKSAPMTSAAIGMLSTSLMLTAGMFMLPAALYTQPSPIYAYLQAHNDGRPALGVFSNLTTPAHTTPSTVSEWRWAVELLEPNNNLDYKVPLFDFFDNLTSRRPSRLVSYAGGRWVTSREPTHLENPTDTLDEVVERLASRKTLLDTAGVRYVVSAAELPSAQFTPVYTTTVTGATLPITIYQNPTARPLVYFADDVTTITEDEHVAFQTLISRRWPNRSVLLECPTACPSFIPTGKGTIHNLEQDSRYLKITTETTDSEWLIVTKNNLPGWKVFIDDQEVLPMFAQTTYFAIPVPAGTHTIELRYSLWQLLHAGLQGIFKNDLGIFSNHH